jgi:hypothetical protein
VAKHVAGFSSDCEYCQGHRNDISNLVTNLDNLPMTKEDVTDYGRTFRTIIKHLDRRHGIHRGSSIMKVLLVVAGISFVVLVVNFGIGIGTTSGWEPAVENTFRFIQTFSIGLFIASIVGIIIMAIIRQLKM